MIGAGAAHEGARLTIDLRALCANWLALREMARPGDCAAVVKANAYGLGLEPVCRALWQTGCQAFFVALPQEAFALRAVLPDADIYCLGGLSADGAHDFLRHDIRPVLNSMPQVEAWRAQSSGRPAALHVDTGMTRLGLTLAEAQVLADAGPAGLSLCLIMSHLACADEPDHPLNDQQIERFNSVRAMFPGVPASLANSAGTLQGSRFGHDLARPGIALYGGEALNHGPNPMLPVIRLEARVMQVRHALAGEAVGYGATRVLARDSLIAVLGVGYADGYHRLVGAHPQACVMINGRPAPLIGRISMDLMAVDISDHDTMIHEGSYMSLIDEHHTVDDVARHAQSIGYEVLTGLGLRYLRTYRGI